ncbi:cell division inhibitor SulA [Enterobacter sp. Ap-916]|uniref:SOS-induced cell division inhibitor SulA n=1 Tax=Enterobacteriaceae TaxID=543 RepID=UPI000272B0F0|nr:MULTISPECIES: SOS-induced cell division inhibitor SulA [unclassified Enterobacter]EJF29433.1 SOS cell division inhibitor [Enterobacter sp. Ag1]NIF60568.1 cell division inhibitor SulA [Enterobacter sp. Ap-867]NIG29850.1 cell division inhibitor SulA [Enterobacter sp. Ap-916]
MHSHNAQTHFRHVAVTAHTPAQSLSDNSVQGLISEVVYSEESPWVTQFILLPLLQQLGQQSRWQLWLTPQQKLSRTWLQAAGLPLAKVMQANQLDPLCTVDAMVKALQTGNYSVVIGWLTEELTDEEHLRLTIAAEAGNAMGFIMRPTSTGTSGSRPRNGLKIHSSLYH